MIKKYIKRFNESLGNDNEPKIDKLEHVKTELKPTYGGQTVLVYYNLITTQHGMKNEYNLTAEIRGIATAYLHLNLLDYEYLTNNENTLTKEAIEDLLNW